MPGGSLVGGIFHTVKTSCNAGPARTSSDSRQALEPASKGRHLMDMMNQKPCQCDNASCGCAGPRTERCGCGDACDCSEGCDCSGQGCDCASAK